MSDFGHLVTAYRALLAISHASLTRLNTDQARAVLRDEIARHLSTDAETVQNLFEAWVTQSP